MVDKNLVETNPKSKRFGKILKNKKFKHGTMSMVITALFLVGLIFFNMIFTLVLERFPSTIDLTANALYSISDKTIDYIKKIDKDVKVTVLANEYDFTSISVYTKNANELLKKYAQYNNNISIEYVDALTNPDVISKYAEYNVTYYDIIFETNFVDENGEENERIKIVSVGDIVNVTSDYTAYWESYIAQSPSYAYQLFEMYGYIESLSAEQEFTSTLMTITDANPVTVTVAKFPGATDNVDISGFTSLLEKNGYIVNSVDISKNDVPEDTNVVVVAAPKIDFDEAATDRLADFLYNDGNLGKDMVYIASPEQGDTPNLDELLAEYGIAVEKNIVCETDKSLYFNYTNFTYQKVVSDKFMDDVTNNKLNLYVPNARNVKLLFTEADKKSVEAFISSYDSSILRPMDAPDDWKSDDAKKGANVTMALATRVVYTDTMGGREYGNVAVFGSLDMFHGSILTSAQFLNGQYIISFMNGLTEKTEGVTIVPKSLGAATFDITEQQKSILTWTFQAVFPVCVLVFGIFVWLRRRNR